MRTPQEDRPDVVDDSGRGATGLARRLAPDLTSFLHGRLSDPTDEAVVAFWDRPSRTYVPLRQRDLFREAAACGARLVASGVEPGAPLLVVAARPRAILTAWFGAALAGALPSVVAVRPSFDDAAALATRLADTAAVLGPRTRAVVDVVGGEALVEAPPALRPVTVALDALAGEAARLPLPPPALQPAGLDQVAFLQLTSGSTGRGRAIAVTHRQLMANMVATGARLELGPRDRIASWLPLYHDMGMVGQALLALLHGLDLYSLTPFEFVADPAAWLHAFGRHGATIGATPNFALDRCCERVPDPVATGLDLSRLRSIFVGAEPVRPAAVRRFADHFAPAGLLPPMMKPCYGLAEATLAVTLPVGGAPPRVTRVGRRSALALGELDVRASGSPWSLGPPGDDEVDLIALGPPLDGLDVEIVDGEGDPVPRDGTCGEVTARGPSLAAGYWVGDAVEPFGERLRTGDLGFLHDGQLHVLERAKHVVIHNGENHSATVLGGIVADALDAPSDAVLVLEPDVIGDPGRLWALVEARRGTTAAELVEQLRPHLDALPLRLAEVLTVPRGALPRTTSGKHQPAEARARLAVGELRVLDRARVDPAGPAIVAVDGAAPVTPAEPEVVIDLRDGHEGAATGAAVLDHVVARLGELCRQRGRLVGVAPGSTLAGDLGLDSIDLFELAVQLEDDLGAVVPESALTGVRTVADLVAVASRTDLDADEGLHAALAAVQGRIPQVFRTVTEQRGRRVRIDGEWLVDMASCNYLGLDLHPEVMASIEPMVRRWGVHPSWTRAVASPLPYAELEAGLADLVGVRDVLVFPTVTLVHQGVLPVLAGRTGTIVLDRAVHQSVQEAAALAARSGTTVRTIPHGDLAALDLALAAASPHGPRVVAVDGVYSMSGQTAALSALVELAERHGADVYVDDAHGFGVLGADPTSEAPYGHGGGGLLRHTGIDSDRVVYVAGMSKAFSSLAAFVSVRSLAERRRFQQSSTMVFSGPVPTASLASALSGLGVNAREGDALRARLAELTQRVIQGIQDAGYRVEGTSFPIVTVVVGGTQATVEACEHLWREGVLLTPAVFPAAPIDAGGVRLTVTATHTDADIEHVVQAFRSMHAAGIGQEETAGALER